MQDAWGCSVLGHRHSGPAPPLKKGGTHGLKMSDFVDWDGGYTYVIRLRCSSLSSNRGKGSDVSASYLFNFRSHISLSEVVDMEVQCSTEHWEAASMHAWAALHPWTDLTPQNLRFNYFIRSFLEGSEEAYTKLRDDHHRLPVILTLIRMLGDIKEREANPIRDFLHDMKCHVGNRALLLRVLDRFMTSPKDPSALCTSKSIIDIVHRVETIHMAHLIGAGDLMDWLYPLLRGEPDSEAARARMIRWSQDKVRMRETAFHSAQIISLVREYPYNICQEGVYVFHAGAVLWCLSGLLSRESTHHETNTAVCRLDYIARYDNEPERLAIRTWIRDGDIRRLSIHGVPDICSELGRQQVLQQTAEILRRMRVWGIAHNFLKVILDLMQKESYLVG
jgi:hypothetical protein